MKLKHLLLHFVLKHNRKKDRKKGLLIGKKFEIPRAGMKSVKTILYIPKTPKKSMPVLFNVHGGAWVGCDASMLDTQSQMLADKLSCLVVNINYTKLDEKPFPYPQNEIKDTVLYFNEHADEYGIDGTRFSLIGYSAGGHLCAGAAILLRDVNFKLNSQFLCYPFLTFVKTDNDEDKATLKQAEKSDKLMDEIFFAEMPKENVLLSPASAAYEQLSGVAPVELITCGEDALLFHSVQYEFLLHQAGVCVARKDFQGAKHGFLEVNFPETKINEAKSPEQDEMMRQAIDYICQRANYHWNINEEE